eukprot:jgi/Bigna1/125983/aug1.1_g691
MAVASAMLWETYSPIVQQTVLPFSSCLLIPLHRIHHTILIQPSEIEPSAFSSARLIFSTSGISSFCSGLLSAVGYSIVEDFVSSRAYVALTKLLPAADPEDAKKREEDTKSIFLKKGILVILWRNISTVVMYPIENGLETYLISCAREALGQGFEYTGPLNAMWKLTFKFGYISGLYEGIGIRMLSQTLQLGFGMAALAAYGHPPSSLDSKRLLQNNNDDDDDDSKDERSFSVEAGVALAAAAITYPLELLLNRQRASRVIEVNDDGAPTTINAVLNRDGVLGLFQGASFFIVRRVAFYVILRSLRRSILGLKKINRM